MSISNISMSNGFAPKISNNGVETTAPFSSSNKQTPYPNLTPLDKDTVNFKGQSTNQKKKGMSGFGKVCLGLLGIGAAAYAGVVTHRIATKPSIDKVAKNFSEIFRKDVSKEEAQKMVDKYKEIFKIKDKDEFCKKIFQQLKKDYGYDGKDLPLVFEKLGKKTENGQIMAHWNPFYGNIALNTEYLETFPQNLNRETQEKITSFITHELQHTKQYEYAFRANAKECLNAISNKDIATEVLKEMINDNYEYTVKSLFENNPKEFKSRQDVEKFIKITKKKLENNSYKNDKTIKNILESIVEQRQAPIKGLFENMNKFQAGSKEYELGLKYIENHKNYINSSIDKTGYCNQLVEAEAFGTAPKAKEIYKYFANPWRIF